MSHHGGEASDCIAYAIFGKLERSSIYVASIVNEYAPVDEKNAIV